MLKSLKNGPLIRNKGINAISKEGKDNKSFSFKSIINF